MCAKLVSDGLVVIGKFELYHMFNTIFIRTYVQAVYLTFNVSILKLFVAINDRTHLRLHVSVAVTLGQKMHVISVHNTKYGLLVAAALHFMRHS